MRDIADALTGMFKNYQDMIVQLRTPTPLKVSTVVPIDGSGQIGGGIQASGNYGQNPATIYAAPLSAEAWIHRISISCPGHNPSSPLTTGEAICYGSNSGEMIFFLPMAGDVAPVQAVEGHLSAPHLSPGEKMLIVGDSLPVGSNLRFDLQIILSTGLTQFTPKTQSPSDVTVSITEETD